MHIKNAQYMAMLRTLAEILPVLIFSSLVFEQKKFMFAQTITI